MKSTTTAFVFATWLDNKISTRRKEDAVGDAERGEDAASPAKGITDLHCNWNILKNVYHNDQETASNKVKEQCAYLGIDVGLEYERGNIREGNDSRWVKQEQ